MSEPKSHVQKDEVAFKQHAFLQERGFENRDGIRVSYQGAAFSAEEDVVRVNTVLLRPSGFYTTDP